MPFHIDSTRAKKKLFKKRLILIYMYQKLRQPRRKCQYWVHPILQKRHLFEGKQAYIWYFLTGPMRGEQGHDNPGAH